MTDRLTEIRARWDDAAPLVPIDCGEDIDYLLGEVERLEKIEAAATTLTDRHTICLRPVEMVGGPADGPDEIPCGKCDACALIAALKASDV